LPHNLNQNSFFFLSTNYTSTCQKNVLNIFVIAVSLKINRSWLGDCIEKMNRVRLVMSFFYNTHATCREVHLAHDEASRGIWLYVGKRDTREKSVHGTLQFWS